MISVSCINTASHKTCRFSARLSLFFLMELIHLRHGVWQTAPGEVWWQCGWDTESMLECQLAPPYSPHTLRVCSLYCAASSLHSRWPSWQPGLVEYPHWIQAFMCRSPLFPVIDLGIRVLLILGALFQIMIIHKTSPPCLATYAPTFTSLQHRYINHVHNESQTFWLTAMFYVYFVIVSCNVYCQYNIF